MACTTAEVETNADPATVMCAIADLAAVAEWSDGVESVEVLAHYPDGRPQRARWKESLGPFRHDFVTEYQWNGNESVTWSVPNGSLLKKEDAAYLLTAKADGRSLVRFEVEIEIAVWVPGILLRIVEKQIVKTGLAGLKAHAENL